VEYSAYGWRSRISDRKRIIDEKGIRNMLKAAKDSLDIGVIVSDIGASLAFYQDILGLQFVGSVPVWFGTMHRLRFGTSDFKLIEPTTMPPPGALGLENQLGFRYVTFVVKDLTELCSELQDKGIEFTLPETQIRPGSRIAMVKDPDGNIVEFVERS
jgi:catechol 2,3-dioxygenase-like lactoylglutathione lyase family enzyme